MIHMIFLYLLINVITFDLSINLSINFHKFHLFFHNFFYIFDENLISILLGNQNI